MLLLRDLGEKEIIRSIIKPQFNPSNILGKIGDDCAIIEVTDQKCVCLSTDRVPADLISFKLGLINYFELGYYLAVLNISDIASCGARPIGLLLTIAFEDTFPVDDFKAILDGIHKACDDYDCQVLGGDLSNSNEMSISATSIGIGPKDKILYRSKAKEDDYLFCTDYIGLTPTAFYYFLNLKVSGFKLKNFEEELLVNQFRKPKAKVILSKRLSESYLCTSCMDNTDGVGQTFAELSEINNLRYCINTDFLPIHDISFKIAEKLEMDILDLILAAGADFQLLGTIDSESSKERIRDIIGPEIHIIGSTTKGEGVWIKDSIRGDSKYEVKGWDYYGGEKIFI